MAVQNLVDDWLSHCAYTVNGQVFVDVVASPDVDGVLSIVFLQKYVTQKTKGVVQVRVAAIYTTVDVIFLGKSTVESLRNALWVDHDVLGNCRSIGNHLTKMHSNDELPRQHCQSVNLNQQSAIAFSNAFRGLGASQKDKYPFGTAHMLAHVFFGDQLNQFASTQPFHSLFAWLAHADGAWLTAQMYRSSALLWYQNEFESAPWMRYLFTDYLANETRFKKHAALVDSLDLALKGSLQTGTSASSQSCEFLERKSVLLWQKCCGSQGVGSCSFYIDDLERLNNDWIAALNRMLALVQVSFSTKPQLLLEPALGALRGTLCRLHASDEQNANTDMAKLLRDENVFSIAYVSKSLIRYTKDLPF